MFSNSCSAAAEDVCPETGWLWLGLVSMLLLCLLLFSVAINALFLLVILRSDSLNANLRAALANISIGVLLHMVSASYRYLVGVAGMIGAVRPTKTITCVLINAPAIFSLIVTVSCLTGLLLERTRTFLKAKAQANHQVTAMCASKEEIELARIINDLNLLARKGLLLKVYY